MRRRLAAILILAGALTMNAGAGAAAGRATPERIVSKRVRILTEDRYRAIEKEWKAYTQAHPKDPTGWAERAKAARYAGAPCEEYVKFAEEAVRLDPDNAEACATLGAFRCEMYCPSQPADPGEAIRLLERALKLDSGLDEPHYTLWVLRLSQGKPEQAAGHLRALLDAGQFPEPLIDLGYNMLVGAEPNAIVLTNGDNDTYPPLALQVGRGFRTDVAIVNLSLLNTPWYRRQLRDGPLHVPVPLLEEKVQGMPSQAALAGLIKRLGKDGWKRPLYVAVTVYRKQYSIPNQLSLEGVLYRVLPERSDEIEISRDLLARNLGELYRLDSASSLGIHWDQFSALGPLMMNYAVAEGRLATGLAGAGDMARAREEMRRALTLCEFHQCSDIGRKLLEEWGNWDAKAPELAKWRKKFE
jgi:tetratricopeptide (TPR) repeat protein